MKKMRDPPRTTWQSLDHRELGPQSQRKPLVTHYALKSAHVQARLKFANDHLDDPEEEWDKVIRSDDTKIELLHLNSIRRVWRKKDEYNPKNPIPTVKQTSFFGYAFLQRGDRTTAP